LRLPNPQNAPATPVKKFQALLGGRSFAVFAADMQLSGESSAGSTAADLCRSVWQAGNAAGGCGYILPEDPATLLRFRRQLVGWGQARAIAFFSAKRGLPPGISGLPKHFYRGTPGYTSACLMVRGDRHAGLHELFESMVSVGWRRLSECPLSSAAAGQVRSLSRG
jgi:hypothetical protein